MENGWYSRTTVDPVEPFEDTLEFDRFQRGRSSAGVTFKRADGREVNVFLKDFAEMIPQMSGGRVMSRWRYVKRGQDYGVALA